MFLQRRGKDGSLRFTGIGQMELTSFSGDRTDHSYLGVLCDPCGRLFRIEANCPD